MINKTLHRKLKIEQHEQCSGGFCSTSETRRAIVKRHEHNLIWEMSWTAVYVNKYK